MVQYFRSLGFLMRSRLAIVFTLFPLLFAPRLRQVRSNSCLRAFSPS